VVVLKEKDDPSFAFHRRGDDLILEKDITLLEALTGYEFAVKHLDDRVLIVRSAEGDITEESDIRVVPNEGMPQHRNPFMKGNLFVKFNIVWPKPGSLTKAQQDALTKVLPPKTPLGEVPMDAEEVHLEPYDEMKHEQSSRGHGRGQAYDEDEAQGPTCVQQ